MLDSTTDLTELEMYFFIIRSTEWWVSDLTPTSQKQFQP